MPSEVSTVRSVCRSHRGVLRVALVALVAGCVSGANNRAPAADAGPDQSVVEGDLVTLSAAASTDSDGAIDSYAWRQTEGPTVILAGTDSVSATFQAPLTNSRTALGFEVTVVDNDGAASTALTRVTVAPNQPPNVDAGADTDAVEGEVFRLRPTVIDDGQISTYEWTQTRGAPVALVAADRESARFVAPEVSDPIELEFALRVTDRAGEAGADSVTVTVNPNEPPAVSVRFPCAGCRAFGSAISVSGRATGGPDSSVVASRDGVSRVAVDAGGEIVQAVVQANGDWFADHVPLPSDTSTVSVSIVATDRFGASSTTRLALRYAPTLQSALLAHDPARPNLVYLVDDVLANERIFAFDLASKRFTKLYGKDLTEFGSLDMESVVVDDAGDRIFTGQNGGGVLVFDTATGARSTLIGPGVGDGLTPSSGFQIAFDGQGDRLIMLDTFDDRLFAVDATTGSASVVATATIGSGPELFRTRAMTVDASSGVAYVSQFDRQYLAVDLSTRIRALLPEAGEPGERATSLDFDGGRLVGLNRNIEVFTVALPSGERRVVSSTSTTGIDFGPTARITVDPHFDRFVISDFATDHSSPDTDRILGVDPRTGDWSVLYADTVGDGPSLAGSHAVAVDAARQVAYLAGGSTRRVVRVSLRDQGRTIVSDATTSTGTPFGVLRDIVLDGDRALVVDATKAALVAVDLATGARSTVSAFGVGEGPPFVRPSSVVLDGARDRAFVLDDVILAIFSVDLTTGERAVVSDNTDLGPALIEPDGIAFDEFNDRLLVNDNGTGSTFTVALLAVDISTGDRTPLSSADVGGGPFLDSLRGVDLINAQEAVVVSRDRVYRVDLVTGDRVMIAAPEMGNGLGLFNMHAMDYDPESRIIYTHSGHYECFFAIDLRTGDRIVISK